MESFRSISLFHQSCATGTLHLRKQIYPRKYFPNLKQVIFFTLLIKIKDNGSETISPKPSYNSIFQKNLRWIFEDRFSCEEGVYRAYTTDEQGNIDRKDRQIHQLPEAPPPPKDPPPKPPKLPPEEEEPELPDEEEYPPP